MLIVCPHCTTSYAIRLETLGTFGRSVRCSRCKQVWLARPEDAIETSVSTPAMADAGADAGAEWEAMARDEETERTPVVDSPPISTDWPAGSAARQDWAAVAREDAEARTAAGGTPYRRVAGLLKLPPLPRLRLPAASLPTTCAAMAALVAALLIWRTDVVRALPQTSLFYRLAGLDVNLRGVAFKDIKVSNETVDGKPVLVIEGMIVGETRRSVELPRLRFAVRDAQGAEIYAWNTVLEQPVLKPGERAYFKSRLASPPPEGRNIDIRFFNNRDAAPGSRA